MARPALLAAAAFALMAASSSQAQTLRGAGDAWRLLAETADTPAPALPLQVKSFQWSPNGSNAFQAAPVETISGGDAILVFHDRTVSEANKVEAALVSFDVRSKANCVVSVCGTFRKWYMGESEQCWSLTVAPKSSNPDENGVIRGISAAYTASRPVAKKMYLKFDSVNYIDGSVCEYQVLSGSKLVTPETLATTERA